MHETYLQLEREGNSPMKSHQFYSVCLASALILGAGYSLAATTTQTPPPAPAVAPVDATKTRAGKADLTPVAAPAAEAVTIKKTEIANYDFWHLQCDQMSDAKQTRHCAARMPVFKANGQQVLAVLIIAQDETAQNWVLKVVIPTSISVQDGGTIAFDAAGAKAQNFPIETCEPQACSSSLPMDAALMGQLKASNKVTLTWTTIDHNPIKFDFEIKGVQQTMKALFG